ncbi:PTS system mannose/fructose/sorbose family transporter subunit IID [Listeria booriae]|uniref:PTS system mannose/fructose/sorbose family transporter subunit IID n=1 Tax=Listeria booriae TaxID=1552123 RepID=A0A7X1CCH5_9LIST|nr:PTS system mannose/fructose/sorbose family transporter subunit IID [Listeria booriae]MBC1492424.1 PTS system mannose/fructose/sorbose family transporter subunit IID [Listeria booriae]MBC1504071.1 PTS system mannose/fructose/sorbose family transporter subunit IID [Listeria booriae]MBC1524282.1 PTS system mannose/fructose/sorbose family transporter subunit IID [Listeria booriae]MBC1531095.1 PTS system mannose/fructose/sorbose family transporter subunit IID [Listeria booriae]MBC6135241.1 PTS s
MAKLTKKDLRKGWLTWAMFNLSSMSFEKLEAHGFAHSMVPIVEKLYKDDPEEKKKALVRHSTFYNTEPQVGSVVNGIIASMEEERSNGTPMDDEVMLSIKTSLMGPVAGIGDSILQGILIPLLLSIGMGLSKTGSAIGVIFYIIAFIGIVGGLSYFLYMRGYKVGVSAIDNFIGIHSEAIRSALNVLGLVVVGGLAAMFVHVVTPIVIPNGEKAVHLQETINSFFPGLLGLAAVLFCWWLIAMKKISAVKVLLILIVVAIVGVFTGVL